MYRKHIQEMESTNTTGSVKTGLKTLDKITELPIVDTTLNKVTDYYGHIKETNGILRTGCNLAEMSFKTLKFASTPITTIMSKPIEHVDTYLSEKVDIIETNYPSIKKPANEITTAAYTQARDLYDRTNEMIYKPKETLYNFKDLTVSTATTCGSKVLESCLDNRYTKVVTDPFLDYTEKTLNYYLPDKSLCDQNGQGTVTRLYNINKRVYNHVYETTFIQLSKLHMHFERTIEKMQALRNLMFNVFTEKKTQVVSTVSEFTLVQKCQTYLKEQNISLERLEELSKGYYKAILADVNDILERYMGLIKNFPAYFNGNQFREKIDFLKNQLNRESFQIYLSVTIDYLKQINQSLMSYTNKMIEVAGESKNTITNVYLSALKRLQSQEKIKPIKETNYIITSKIYSNATNTSPRITRETSTQISLNKTQNSIPEEANESYTTNNSQINSNQEEEASESFETSTDSNNVSDERVSEDESFTNYKS